MRRSLASRIPRLCRVCICLLTAATVGYGVLLPRSAAAQNVLVFERNGTLFATAWERATNGTPAPLTDDESRPLHEIGSVPGTLWAAAPDGRRIVWLVPAADTGDASLFLGDMTGRRSKRLLVLSRLKDHQGRPVMQMARPEPDAGNANPAASLAVPFSTWKPVSVSWSADSRTLYVSGTFLSSQENAAVKAAYAVDALTGAAIVDGDGNWKPIVDAAYLHADGGLLVGAGLAFLPASNSGDDKTAPPKPYSPLLLFALAEGSRVVLEPPQKMQTPDPPAFAFAAMPSLSPDHKQIAYVSGGTSLWMVDTAGSRHSQIAEGDIRHPRWTPDGAGILFVRREIGGSSPAYALYELPQTLDASVPPTRILERVSWFDIVPE